MHFFSIFLLKYLATFRKKAYLCTIKIINNRAAQLVKHCTEDMTQQEIQTTLAANRDIVINYFNENCKDDKFYNLKWFMTSILKHAQITWVRRKNIAEKDVMSVINQIVKCNPFLLKGYKSNWEKAVYYHGYDLAKNISNCK